MGCVYGPLLSKCGWCGLGEPGWLALGVNVLINLMTENCSSNGYQSRVRELLFSTYIANFFCVHGQRDLDRQLDAVVLNLGFEKVSVFAQGGYLFTDMA